MVTLLKSLLNSEGSANVTKVGALNSSLYDPSTDLTDMGYPKQVKRRGIFDPSPDLVELVPQSTGDDGCGDGLGCIDDLLTSHSEQAASTPQLSPISLIRGTPSVTFMLAFASEAGRLNPTATAATPALTRLDQELRI